jgi:NAD(P)-dependent dehydrogenase (short-subunit alcohol dehydrogenase family)
MQLHGAIALVTGANRDLGRHFAEEMLRRGVAKVYATARRPELVDLAGVEVLPLDITDPASVAAAAAAAGDVTLLINNAGVSHGVNLVDGDLAKIRATLDVHFYGTLAMIRAFAPVLGANGGGAILNVLSNLSWLSYDGNNAYAVAKAAEWSLTNGVRLELADQDTLVSGLVFGDRDHARACQRRGDERPRGHRPGRARRHRGRNDRNHRRPVRRGREGLALRGTPGVRPRNLVACLRHTGKTVATLRTPASP